MSRILLVFAVVMALPLGMMGCKEKTASETASDAAKSAGRAVRDAAEDAGEAVGDAAKATGEFLSESKDSAVKTAQETITGLETKWQALQQKAAPTTEAAKADFQKAKDQMAQVLADAKARLVEAKDAGAEAWQQNVQPALAASLQKAQKLYEDTAAKFGGE